jgi:hypothetical protein
MRNYLTIVLIFFAFIAVINAIVVTYGLVGVLGVAVVWYYCFRRTVRAK